ncbi:hypothetical protein [Dictyobacter formicarum]|uniref:Uncharacterized protein n=1 Tax=Dictyobacter formicarum TaxID=2778368 RepID=A0ABQ3V9I4_9CHLR|nr:hypothetical protein [Dictyobacter formicarum]GHO82449.1 hypothetical protein KSZ_04550 [Dictyobacter formicarum]
MHKYCKAYHVSAMRQFSDWAEKRAENEDELSDDSIVYLWDDFTVVRSPVIPDKGLVFDEVTDAWKDFCLTTLQFSIPEDLRYADEQIQEAGDAQKDTVEQAPSHP